MAAIVAVDIGGTQIRAAAYPKDDVHPIKIQRTATVAGDADVFERMTSLIDSVWPEEQVEAISVAAAGPLDPETGIIIDTPNIPGWKDFPLRGKLEEHFHVPIYVGNDANLAAVGEWRYGAGQGHHHVLYLTISTGIGGGVISNDRLLEGAHGMAAELGHIVVLSDGPLCSCGVRGHLEAVASGPAIARYISEQIAMGRSSRLASSPNLSAREAAEAARLGDELAVEAFQRAGTYIGQAVAGFLHIFNPSIVIFGGGVSQSGAILFDPLREAMQRSIMAPAYLDNLEIAIARLGDDVGMLGALAQARILLDK